MGSPFKFTYGQKFSSNENFDDLDELDAYTLGGPAKTQLEARNKDAAWALKLVSNFKAQSSASAFQWPMQRADVADQLAIRVNDPTKINQRNTWLCGVTSVMRAWAQDDPIDYAWLGIQLYNNGRGRIGRGAMLGQIVEPSLDLRRSSIPVDMKAADWIVLASVHESLTKKYGSCWQDVIGAFVGGRNYTSDEGLGHYRAWQTVEEVVAAYKATGYKSVVDNTSCTSNKGIQDLERANQYLKDAYQVSLLINDRLLGDSTIGTQALVATSDHWIGMLERINVIGDYIFAFNVFSWGQKRRVPQSGDKILASDFFKEFYGFVAARYY
jgi:hypothetical protein